MCTASRKASELDECLKEAHCRTLELAQQQKIQVEELDLRVGWYISQEPVKDARANMLLL
jgi:hypothetical protein